MTNYLENTSGDNSGNLPWYKKTWGKTLIGFFVLVGIVNIFSGSDEETPISVSTVTQESAQTTPEESQIIEETVDNTEPAQEPENSEPASASTMPADQKAFMEQIYASMDEIDAAETELQRAVALRTRDDLLCKILSDFTATDWIGSITEIGATGDGEAHVEIELDNSITVKTWNNSFSDISDNTLIKPSDPNFAKLVAMSENMDVVFSAKFLRGRDFCLKQGNLTDVFYGVDPKFIVKFVAIDEK